MDPTSPYMVSGDLTAGGKWQLAADDSDYDTMFHGDRHGIRRGIPRSPPFFDRAEK
jgi:hypothetical protein